MSIPSGTTKTQRGVQPVAGCMPTNRRRSWRPSIISACAVILSGAIGVKEASGQHCMYEIVGEISTPGCFPGELAPIVATAINDNSVVVGYFFDCAFNEQPFMWSAERGFVAIPLPPGVLFAKPMDIDDQGEMVGSLAKPNLGKELAFHWADDVWTELPSLPGSTNTTAFAINDFGVIVGESANTITGPAIACVWKNGTISALDLPLGPNSAAFDISDASLAVGRMGGSSYPFVPFLWTRESATALPTLRNTFRSEALAVNEHMTVVGQAFVETKSGSVPRRSWMFENRQLTDLGVLPEADHRTIANDINDARQVVGDCFGVANATNKPFLWQNGSIIELQTLITNPPEHLFLLHAYAINNAGQIVVQGASQPMFVLAPVGRPLGDVNIDCVVDERDLVAVLEDWGPAKLYQPTDQVTSATFQPPADGVVDAADLAIVLGNWSVSSSPSLPARR